MLLLSTFFTMVLKLVRVDENAEVCKTIIPEGISYIGRGPLLDCADLKVSRKHGELNVMEDCIYIKSLHERNPCFIKRQNSNKLIVVNYQERCPLNNGDRIGLLPDNYWYEVIFTQNMTETQECGADEVQSAGFVRKNTDSLEKDDPPPQSNSQNTDQSTQDLNSIQAEESRKRHSDSESPFQGKIIKQEPVTPTKLDVKPLLSDITPSDTNLPSTSVTSNGQLTDTEMPAQNDKQASDDTNTDSGHSNDETVSDKQLIKLVKIETVEGPADGDRGPSPVVNNNPSSSSAQVSVQNATIRERCRYGVSCYRKNPLHLQQFSHPNDPDWSSSRIPQPRLNQGRQVVLRYGNCFYVDAQAVHFHDKGFWVEDSDGDGADYDQARFT